jgi:hypothetical protein
MATASLIVRDDTTSAARTAQTIDAGSVDAGTVPPMVLEFLTEHVTVREIIRARVYQDVQDEKLAHAARRARLVQPGHRAAGEPDFERAFTIACDSFTKHAFILLVGNTQADSLDQRFTITPGMEVTFLRLVPLVGG